MHLGGFRPVLLYIDSNTLRREEGIEILKKQQIVIYRIVLKLAIRGYQNKKIEDCLSPA